MTEHYEIRVRGRLGPHWAASFEGLTLVDAGDGTTLITGLVADQSALHGVLRQLRDVGLPLVSITQITRYPSDIQSNSTHPRKDQP